MVCSTCCFRSNSFALCERCVGFGAVLAFIMVEKVYVSNVLQLGMAWATFSDWSVCCGSDGMSVCFSQCLQFLLFIPHFFFIKGLFFLAHLLCVLLFSHLHMMFFGGCCLFCLHRFGFLAIMWCAKCSDV